MVSPPIEIFIHTKELIFRKKMMAHVSERYKWQSIHYKNCILVFLKPVAIKYRMKATTDNIVEIFRANL